MSAIQKIVIIGHIIAIVLSLIALYYAIKSHITLKKANKTQKELKELLK